MTIPPIRAALASLMVWSAFGQPYKISTFAGGGLPVNIQGASAYGLGPGPIATDRAGNVFFANVQTAVLRLDAKTGVLTLVAGNGTPGYSGDNGLATNAQLKSVIALAFDPAGNLYIADWGNSTVRKVSNGVITTVAGNGFGTSYDPDGGPATGRELGPVSGVALDAAGSLYFADQASGRIRKVSNGVVTTVAGNGRNGYSGDNGPATSAQLSGPQAIAIDAAGNLYICDTGNHRIRKVSGGTITTVAGTGKAGYAGDDGPAAAASLNYPIGLAVDAAGNLLIADYYNNRVRKVSGGVITTVAGGGSALGDNGVATDAKLVHPYGVTVDAAGALYIADSGNVRVRKVSNGVITTVAGGSAPLDDKAPSAAAQLFRPSGVAVDAAGSLYIADQNSGRIRKVSSGEITTIVGDGTKYGYAGDNGPATSAVLSSPRAVAVDAAGNLYVCDTYNDRIRKVSGGTITTVAGNGTGGKTGDGGPATSAQLNYPTGVAVDAGGNLYIADSNNHRIRKVSAGTITTVAGNGTSGYSGDGGLATSARLNYPKDVAVDSDGNLYISDTNNHRIRKVANGIITTVAGIGPGVGGLGDGGPATSAVLTYPEGVAVDAAGSLYIADTYHNRIRKVSGGVMTTVAGTGEQVFGGDNGPATSASLHSPTGVAADAAGNVYVAESGSGRIRILTPGIPPVIFHDGIVPVGSAASAIQAGSWISIFGSNLAGATAIWNGDFPLSLAGTSVTVDNKPAYIWFVSPQQINLQVPDGVSKDVVSVVVTTAAGSSSSTVTVADAAPALSLLGDGKHAVGQIATPGGNGAYGGGAYDLVGPPNTFSYATRPVKAGEILTLYGVGFGATIPAVPAGQPFSGAARTNSPVTVTLGGVPAPVAFAGIVQAGLFQLNIVVPANTGSGDQAIQATVNGVQTPSGIVVTVQ